MREKTRRVTRMIIYARALGSNAIDPSIPAIREFAWAGRLTVMGAAAKQPPVRSNYPEH